MRSHILKTLPKRESRKRIISASSGFGLLQMVSEPDTGRYANEEAEARRGVDTRRCASKDTGPRRRLIGRFHIDWRRERVLVRTLRPDPHRLGRRMKHSLFFIRVQKPLPSKRVLKTLRESLKRKATISARSGFELLYA